MKRKDFFKSIGLGMVAATIPLTANAAKGKTMEEFVHDPADYAMVPEEPEEFQEWEVDVPDDWAEEEIIWI